jgi:protein TonB
MTFPWPAHGPAFKRAFLVSAIFHAALLAVIVANPSLPKKPSPKGVIHYLNLGGGGGPAGGGGGGGQAQVAATPIQKESLRDLTTVQKLETRKMTEPEYRYPVDKPKKTPTKTPDKKAVISKPEAKGQAAEAGRKTKAGEKGAAEGTGGGSGLTFGPPGSGGEGYGFGGDPGLSNFPFTWYLIEIRNKIQNNWFPSVVEVGAGASLKVWVYFRIYRDGSISVIEKKESSGIDAFDMNAVRAIINARPFPPLPREYEGEYIGLNLQFEHVR